MEAHPRIHLDLFVDTTAEQEAEVERLVALGASKLDWGLYPPEPDFIVLGDPDGNAFCIVELSQAPSGDHSSSYDRAERATVILALVAVLAGEGVQGGVDVVFGGVDVKGDPQVSGAGRCSDTGGGEFAVSVGNGGGHDRAVTMG